MDKGRVRKRRRNLFSRKKESVPQDGKVALFKCLSGLAPPVDKLPVCGFRFGVPFHVLREQADALLSGFQCPRCEKANRPGLYIKWENYELFRAKRP